MTSDRRHLHAIAATLFVGIVGIWASQADAHAVFVGPPAGIPADTDVALTMNVPNERDDTTFNVGVAIRLPEGWSGVTCQTKPTWTCSIGTESGRVVVHFDKDPSAAQAEDETFQYTLHAGPTPGAVSLPTLQTYNTGEVVAWIGGPGDAEPAPTLQVTGAAPAAPPVAAPTNPPATNPPVTPTVAPAPTVPPVPTTAAPAATTTAPAPASTTSASTTTTTTAPTTSTAASTTTSSTSTTLALAPTVTQPGASGSGGGIGGLVAVIVLALLAAGAGRYVYLRRRQRAAPPPSLTEPDL